MTAIKYRSADVDGLKIFYREAGAADAPVLLLLHGFLSAGHMSPGSDPAHLADRFHIVAPDLPGFGQSDMPARGDFTLHLRQHRPPSIDRFTEVIGLQALRHPMSSTMCAPTGLRIAAKHPDRISAIITQNGNAYEEGLSEGWNPEFIGPTGRSRRRRQPASASRAFLAPETTRWQYTPRRGLTRRPSLRTAGRWTISIWRAPGADEIQLGFVWRLQEQRRARIRTSSELLPGTHRAAAAGGMGQERSVLPAAGRRGVQARHSRRRRSLLRHRPFRAGDACRGRSSRGDP